MSSFHSKISQDCRVYSFFAILFIIISSLSKNYKPDNADYLLYGLFILISIIKIIDKRHFYMPQKYIVILLIFISYIVINAFVTEYAVEPKYYAVGVVISCLPFIHFIISHNQNIAFPEILYLIDRMIRTICLCAIIIVVETLLGGVTGIVGFISTKIFMIGFVASLCNQGLIISLGTYHLMNDEKYKRIAIFLIVVIVLTNQLKAITCMLLILGIYFLLLRKVGKSRHWGKAVIIVVCSFQVLMFIPQVQEKVLRYTEMYGNEYAKDGIARVAMYYTAFQIANDHFPFGTGQGTYGSIAANLSGNDKIYYDYGISGIWGLSRTDDVDFRMDAYGASIIGEQGYVGTFLYLVLLFFPFFYIMKRTKNHPYRKYYLFISGLTIISILIESISLSLMNRLSFIFCYSGLSALFIREIGKGTKGLNKEQYNTNTLESKIKL